MLCLYVCIYVHFHYTLYMYINRMIRFEMDVDDVYFSHTYSFIVVRLTVCTYYYYYNMRQSPASAIQKL